MIYGYHLYIDNLENVFQPEAQLVGAILSRIDQPQEGINLARLYGTHFSEALNLKQVNRLLLAARAFTDKDHKHEVAMVKAANINGHWLNVTYTRDVVGHVRAHGDHSVTLTDGTGASEVI